MSDLLGRLVDANVFIVGEFKLKSGALSPIYIDLRRIIAFPQLVGDLAKAMRNKQLESGVQADVVCGVPYTALPVASVFSYLYNTPMVVKRKEAKDYGTKKMVEGVIRAGESCVIVEDIVTSGTSVIETVDALQKEGLVVTDCLVILDRQQGGEANLTKAGIRLHSLFTISDFFRRYCSVKKVEPAMVKSVERYLKDNDYIPPSKSIKSRLSFDVRARTATQPVAKHLLNIIASKETNLCVAVDVTRSDDLLRLADVLGPHICLLKTHSDVMSDFDATVAAKLSALAVQHDFLVLEDRKFADIGNTVLHQYVDGPHRIREWADIVTVHSVPGAGILQALKKATVDDRNRACVMVAEMSSKGALTDASYHDRTEAMAKEHRDFVIGLVEQTATVDNQELIRMCPGVSLSAAGDSLGQQYRSPEEAVASGADVIIVGRGVCSAQDVVEAAVQYKTRSYAAYLQHVTTGDNSSNQ